MSDGRRLTRNVAFRDTRRQAAAVTPRRHGAWLLLAALPLLAFLSGCEGTASAEGVTGGYGYVCHAGFYQCTLPAQVPLGSRCSCPGLGAPSYGRVG